MVFVAGFKFAVPICNFLPLVCFLLAYQSSYIRIRCRSGSTGSSTLRKGFGDESDAFFNDAVVTVSVVAEAENDTLKNSFSASLSRDSFLGEPGSVGSVVEHGFTDNTDVVNSVGLTESGVVYLAGFLNGSAVGVGVLGDSFTLDIGVVGFGLLFLSNSCNVILPNLTDLLSI